jgi:hypothetical protein
LRNAPPSSFLLRRSSNANCFALTHKIGSDNFGHALIQWSPQGFSLADQGSKTHPTIEALIAELNLTPLKVRKPRPDQVDGKRVLFQVEAITNYHAQGHGELSFSRGDFVNVYDESVRGFFVGEIDGRHGKFPSGMTKKLLDTVLPGYQSPDFLSNNSFVPLSQQGRSASVGNNAAGRRRQHAAWLCRRRQSVERGKEEGRQHEEDVGRESLRSGARRPRAARGVEKGDRRRKQGAQRHSGRVQPQERHCAHLHRGGHQQVAGL